MTARDAIVDAYHREWAKVLAAVVRTTGDLDLAEEATQDAYAAAVATWHRGGVPDRPAAWLITTARRKAVDRLRRERGLRRRLPLLVIPEDPGPYGTGGDESSAPAAADSPLRDERLRLIFTCCHPALSAEARVALTLRLVCGLSTADIARICLVPEPTMAARITRAKKKIRAAAIPYRRLAEDELPDRVPAVVSVVYLLFTAGYTAPSGTTLHREEPVARAIALARTLVTLLPDEPAPVGLLALMLLTDARREARVDEAGGLVLLADQDRSRWDATATAEGRDLVEHALRRTRDRGGRPDPYVLQAAIAALHAEAARYEDTDWRQIRAVYDLLLVVQPSPVAALARTVSHAMVDGAEAGLAGLDELVTDPRLATYYLLPAVRADLLARIGRFEEAAADYARAADMADNDVERDFLRWRSIGMMRT